MAKDLRAFITYLTSLWGMLAGITAVFPLADVFLKVIPLPVDPYDHATAPIAIPITTLVALFILLYSFVQRNQIDATMSRRASILFVVGLLSLVVFFLMEHFEYALRSRLLPDLDSTDDYVLLMVGVVPFYVLFFACVSRAFAILALIEFKRQ